MNLPFEESCDTFRKFLAGEGWPRELSWLRPDDVLLTGRRFLYVKSPTPTDNLSHYRNQFDIGMDRQLGVLIKGLCRSKNTTYCFVWIPEDAQESMQHMMPKGPDGLKMSVLTGLSEWPIQEVRNNLSWLYLRLRYKSKQEFKNQMFS